MSNMPLAARRFRTCGRKISFTARKYDLIVGYFRANWPRTKFPILEGALMGHFCSTKR